MLIQNKYEIIGKIGSGSYSNVYKAKNIYKPDSFCAIKFEIEDDKISKALLHNEISNYLCLMKNKCQNIVNVKSFGIFNKTNYIIMSLLDIELGDYVTKLKENMTSKDVMKLFIKTYKLIQNMHYSGLVHRDIKPDNFLVKEKTGEIFIVDMGISTKIENIKESTKVIGTPLYCSYNTHLDKYTYTKHDDIISLFFVFFKLFGGKLPWENICVKSEKVKNYIMFYLKQNSNFSMYYDEELLRELITTYEYYLYNKEMPENITRCYI